MPLIWFNQAVLDARYRRIPFAAGGGDEWGLYQKRLVYSSNTLPTVAPGANNTGTGAATTFSGVRGDIMGTVQIVTGSTATAGPLARVTFSTPQSGSGCIVFLQMASSHPDAQPYFLNANNTSFDIALGNIATGQTYLVSYFVVEYF